MKNAVWMALWGCLVSLGPSLSAQNPSLFPPQTVAPRMRVILDNDFGGDPDGLVQLAHHVLSPSVEIRGIVSSYFKAFMGGPNTPESASDTVRTLLKKMGLEGAFPIYNGAGTGLKDSKTPVPSEGAKAIVREALREDTKLPLYVVCGGGLTDIASAYLMEPAIAKRLTLIWIGGPEHSGLALPPPGHTPLEYNLGIDIPAAQVVFNHSDLPLWQIPRDAYRQALFSYAELLYKIKDKGSIGAYLATKVEDVMRGTQRYGLPIGETYILGDSPLVLLTALQSSFEADPSSSKYILKPAPKISDAGWYDTHLSARNIRVYTQLDTRLMLDDFVAKLALHNGKK